MSKLKELRKRKGVTQKEVATMLNITRAAYSNIENNNRDPDTKTLIKLANYFGVTTDYILGLTDNPNTPKSNMLSQEDMEALEKGRKLKSLPADRQKSVEILMNYDENAATKSN